MYVRVNTEGGKGEGAAGMLPQSHFCLQQSQMQHSFTKGSRCISDSVHTLERLVDWPNTVTDVGSISHSLRTYTTNTHALPLQKPNGMRPHRKQMFSAEMRISTGNSLEERLKGNDGGTWMIASLNSLRSTQVQVVTCSVLWVAGVSLMKRRRTGVSQIDEGRTTTQGMAFNKRIERALIFHF